jgi:hypothetical protein
LGMVWVGSTVGETGKAAIGVGVRVGSPGVGWFTHAENDRIILPNMKKSMKVFFMGYPLNRKRSFYYHDKVD